MKKIELKYRGATYQYAPTMIQMTEEGIAGTYEGQHWQVQEPLETAKLQPIFNLKYRGVAYTIGQVVVPTFQKPSFPRSSVSNRLVFQY